MPTHFPPWLKKQLPPSGSIQATREILAALGINTVCNSALCPNLGECFARHTATFMILGGTCTRRCGYCAVQGGVPQAPDPTEPERVAEAAIRLELQHVVITSVTRDDLPDGGAAQFAATVQAVARRLPGAVVEVLIPDLGGSRQALAQVVEAHPLVINHNIETVPRLYRRVRPRASYNRSLELLAAAKELNPLLYTKSGLMVGLGEEPPEVEEVLGDLRLHGVDVLTIGQYLQPSPRHLKVEEFVTPEQFADYRSRAAGMGFLHVAAGPFVRSSYQADQFSREVLAHPAGAGKEPSGIKDRR